jgi:predicted transcriptional regulator
MVQREQFSVKIPESMEERIEAFAAETHRTKSNALIHLMWVGAEAGEDYVDPESDGPGVKTPISVSTEFVDVVGRVSELADDRFGETFSQAVRWAIRNGLAAENGEQ